MEASIFWRELYFCQQDFSFGEERERSLWKLDQENRVNVQKHSTPPPHTHTLFFQNDVTLRAL